MLRDAAVAIIKGRLARINNSDLTDYVISEMQLQQTLLEEAPKLPWFLVEEFATTTFSTTDNRVSVPSDFLLEHEDGALWIENSDGTLTEVGKDDLDAIIGRDSTQSFKYTLIGEYFRIYPLPAADKTIRIVYYAQDTVLDSNVENGWLKYAPDLLIAMTGQKIAAYVKDFEALSLFKADEAVALRRLWGKQEARVHTNRDYAMGDD